MPRALPQGSARVREGAAASPGRCGGTGGPGHFLVVFFFGLFFFPFFFLLVGVTPEVKAAGCCRGTTGSALPRRGRGVGKGCAGSGAGSCPSCLQTETLPARSPTPLFARTCCRSRNYRRDPRNGGSNGAFLSPLPSFDCRTKRTPHLLPCPRPSQAPPGGSEARGPCGDIGSLRSPLTPSDLLRK